MMMIFWIALAAAGGLVVWRVLASQGGANLGSKMLGGSPEEVLKRRYARGEIDQPEFERRINELRR
jgi:uncharacterized membrane protein